MSLSPAVRRALIEPGSEVLSIRRQCRLLGLARSSFYYQPCQASAENLHLMRLMDAQHMATPFYGARRMTAWLRRQGYPVNLKRVRRLMQRMGLVALYPRPRLSGKGDGHEVYPYLLKGLEISRPNQVWGSDITYIPMARGFMYLAAVIDWYSRYVVAWRLSNTLSEDACIEMVGSALQIDRPDIFNTDQGSQFTSRAFVGQLKAADVRISMDGKGRAIDNVFTERLWWSVKYEHVYLHAAQSGFELWQGLEQYIHFYNHERLHQSLGYRTPAEVYAEINKR